MRKRATTTILLLPAASGAFPHQSPPLSSGWHLPHPFASRTTETFPSEAARWREVARPPPPNRHRWALRASTDPPPIPDTTDPFVLLGLDPSCHTVDKGEIKRAYRRMALRYHPDLVLRSDSTDDERRRANNDIAKINAAYELLSGKGGNGGSNGVGRGARSGGGRTTPRRHSGATEDRWSDFMHTGRSPHASSSTTQTASGAESDTGRWSDYVDRRSGPHASSSSSSQTTSRAEASTDWWGEYMPNHEDDAKYDAGGDSFSNNTAWQAGPSASGFLHSFFSAFSPFFVPLSPGSDAFFGAEGVEEFASAALTRKYSPEEAQQLILSFRPAIDRASAKSLNCSRPEIIAAKLCSYAAMYDSFRMFTGGISYFGEEDGDTSLRLTEWIYGYRIVLRGALFAGLKIKTGEQARVAFSEMAGTGGEVRYDQWCDYLERKEVEGETGMAVLFNGGAEQEEKAMTAEAMSFVASEKREEQASQMTAEEEIMSLRDQLEKERTLHIADIAAWRTQLEAEKDSHERET